MDWDLDRGLGLGIVIGDCDWGLKFGIGVWGLGIRDCDWEFGIRLGTGIWHWDWG